MIPTTSLNYHINAMKISKSFYHLCLIFIIGAPLHDIVRLKSILHQSRNYLKLDYKLHITRFSRIADHCANHALSDPNEKKWSEICDHQHDQQ